MAEYYRQFAFVSSVLAGFAFTFYGALLVASSTHRAAGWAAILALCASVACLIVTLGTTFAAARAAGLPAGVSLPQEITANTAPISMCFLLGIIFLFASFGVSGWIRSRRLGAATTTVAVLGLLCAFWVLRPFLHAA